MSTVARPHPAKEGRREEKKCQRHTSACLCSHLDNLDDARMWSMSLKKLKGGNLRERVFAAVLCGRAAYPLQTHLLVRGVVVLQYMHAKQKIHGGRGKARVGQHHATGSKEQVANACENGCALRVRLHSSSEIEGDGRIRYITRILIHLVGCKRNLAKFTAQFRAFTTMFMEMSVRWKGSCASMEVLVEMLP